MTNSESLTFKLFMFLFFQDKKLQKKENFVIKLCENRKLFWNEKRNLEFVEKLFCMNVCLTCMK